MRYDEKRKRFVPTTTEIIERERRLWKIQIPFLGSLVARFLPA
jgi:hypothetical protein